MTGFGQRAEVLEIVIVDTTGATGLDAVSLPQGRIPSDASAMHGLPCKRLRGMDARPWLELHSRTASLIESAAVVCARYRAKRKRKQWAKRARRAAVAWRPLRLRWTNPTRG